MLTACDKPCSWVPRQPSMRALQHAQHLRQQLAAAEQEAEHLRLEQDSLQQRLRHVQEAAAARQEELHALQVRGGLACACCAVDVMPLGLANPALLLAYVMGSHCAVLPAQPA